MYFSFCIKIMLQAELELFLLLVIHFKIKNSWGAIISPHLIPTSLKFYSYA